MNLSQLVKLVAQLSIEEKQQLQRYLTGTLPTEADDAMDALVLKLHDMGALPEESEEVKAALYRVAQAATSCQERPSADPTDPGA